MEGGTNNNRQSLIGGELSEGGRRLWTRKEIAFPTPLAVLPRYTRLNTRDTTAREEVDSSSRYHLPSAVFLEFSAGNGNTWNIHLNAAEFVVSSNKQCCPVITTKGKVGRAPVTEQDRSKMLAGGIDDPDATRPGAVYIALSIHFHTIGDTSSGAAQIAEKTIRRQIQHA